MRRYILFLVLCFPFCAAPAQRISRNYQGQSLSHVLEDLNGATRHEIAFVYNDLEDFLVSCQLKHATIGEALEKVVGFYPVRVMKDGDKYFVECTYKTEHHLTGTLTDEQGLPVAFANIAVLNPADSAVISGGVSNEAGQFVVPYEVPEAEAVVVRISYVGYKTLFRRCTQEQLGTIGLQPENYTINGVLVKGHRSLVRNQVDRLQYIVAADEFAKGLDGQELMRRVPLLQVTDDGVAIVGKTTTHFLLDGREMPDNMLHAKLKALHAEDIERIEVISIPPSKYKAESNAGYVNIVLRRDQTLGVSGTLGGGMSHKERTSGTLSPSLNYAGKRLDVSFSGWLERINGRNDRSSVITFADHEKTSDATYRFKWRMGNANLLVKYQLSKQFAVGFLGSLSANRAQTHRHDVTEEHQVVTTADAQSPDDRYLNLSGEVFADWTISPKGKMLTLTYDYLNNYQEEDDQLMATASTGDWQQPSPLHMQTTGDNRYRIDALKADFALQYPVAHVETGLAYTNIGNRSAIAIFSDESGQWAKNRNQSNRFSYKEQTAAAYLSAHREFGSKLSAKAGLRLEKTWTEGTLEESRASHRNNYLYLFPTVHLAWKPSGRTNVGLAYSKGLNRPSFNDLNPFRYYQTPTSYIGGNPYLQPGRTDNVELNFNNGRGLYAVLYESHQGNAGGMPTTFSEDGMQSSVPDNCFTTDKAGLYASCRCNIASWWNLMLGGEVFFAQSRVTKPSTSLKGEHGWSGKAELDTDWFLNRRHTLAINVYYTHYFPYVNFMGCRQQTLVVCGARLRYALFNDRLQLRLTVSDPFRQNVNRSTTRYGGYTIRNSNDVYMRSIGFSASYSFGGSKVRRSYRQSKNTDASRAAAR